MTPAEHYAAAESLLAEGEQTVRKISKNAELRATANSGYREVLTREMDELGKKAMGIWAQAQVHATLATPGEQP